MGIFLAQAQSANTNMGDGFSYQLLEPIQCNSATNCESFGALSSTSVAVTPTSFADFVNGTINYILIIVSIAAIIYFIYGGLTYLTTDIVNKKSEGKDIIVRVVSGLLFVFLVFAIFKSINPDALKAAVNFSDANVKIETPTQPDTRDDYVTSDDDEDPNTEVPTSEQNQTNTQKFNQIKNDDTRVTQLLDQIGVRYKTNYCTYYGQKACTSYGLLPSKAIDGLGNLISSCKKYKSDCSITVSGGTEFWLHKTHGPDKAVVDISKSSSSASFAQYVRTLKTLGPSSPFEQRYEYIGGLGQRVMIGDEDSSHWHLIFY